MEERSGEKRRLNVPATAAPLSLVGSGATLVATNAITVSNGASVRIRGLTVTATSAAITCGDTSAPRSKLVLEDVIVQAGDTTMWCTPRIWRR